MDESGEGQGNLINFLPKAQGRKNSLIIPMSMSGKIKDIEELIHLTLLWFEDSFSSGRESLGYSEDEDVYAVLEEDGTEVDEEEYFMMLEHR